MLPTPLASPPRSSRNDVLAAAVQMASVRGLEAMTLGDLSAATGRAKSSIVSGFKSKQGLQLAILDEAERLYFDTIADRAKSLSGPAQLQRLLEGWIDCSAGDTFRGGCLLASGLHDMDGRPGPVRDRVFAFADRWATIIREVAAPLLVGSDLTAHDVAFRALGIGFALNIEVQLGHRERGTKSARQAIAVLLQEMTRRQPETPARPGVTSTVTSVPAVTGVPAVPAVTAAPAASAGP